MKKLTIFLTVLLSITFLTIQESSAQDEKTIKFIIGEQEFLAVLYDTPAANALYERLPLTLTFLKISTALKKLPIWILNFPQKAKKWNLTPMWAICVFMLHGAIYPFFIKILETLKDLFL